MTKEEKIQIEDYRRKGIGYKQIAKELGISPNSVKSYCRRNKLQNEDLEQVSMETLSNWEPCLLRISPLPLRIM